MATVVTLASASPLTASEAAAVFGVTASTVNGWARKGKFPEDFRTLGGQRRWHAATIRAIITGTGHGEAR